jgi:DDE superfamily endonuclease
MVYMLNNMLDITFKSQDEDYLEQVSAGFRRNGRSPLSGCAGALDGLAVKIMEPARGSVANPSTYFNRKGFFSLSLQAMCDNKIIFTFASALCPGSTHDSTAFAMSSLSRLLSDRVDGLRDGYWIAADDVYVCSDRVITPWPGRRLSVTQDAFNYWLSSTRIHIEQAFGMLVGRWGIFWRPLRLTVDKAGQVVLLCIKLHNYIIQKAQESDCDTSAREYSVPDHSNMDDRGHRDQEDTRTYMQDEVDLNETQHRRRSDLEASSQRDGFTQLIMDSGLTRPVSS